LYRSPREAWAVTMRTFIEKPLASAPTAMLATVGRAAMATQRSSAAAWHTRAHSERVRERERERERGRGYAPGSE
jgi:hypothetical protein